MRTCYLYNMSLRATDVGTLPPGRQRIRRRIVRVVILDPGNTVPPRRDGRRNPHGWRFANEARRRKGRQLANRMLLRRLAKWPADVIADYFGTTRAAVYQRLYRLRSGKYA
jgi:hypothetical protein